VPADKPTARRTPKRTRGALGASDRPVRASVPGSGRAAAERHLAFPVAYIAQLPRWLPFLVVVALVLVAGFVGGVVGGVLLLVVAALLGALAYLSWPTLPPAGRGLRVAAIAMVTLAAVLLVGK
jgi:uncharacterized protein DUF6703